MCLSLVEKLPSESEVEPKLFRRVSGDDAVGLLFKITVEMSCFGINTGSFYLKVDEKVGPEVVAYISVVLTEEYTKGGVVGVGFEEGVVTEVDTYLCMQDTAEKIEVGID